jgi:hypothetical protein
MLLQVTTGSQDALAKAIDMLVSENTTVIVEGTNFVISTTKSDCRRRGCHGVEWPYSIAAPGRTYRHLLEHSRSNLKTLKAMEPAAMNIHSKRCRQLSAPDACRAHTIAKING